MVLITEMLIKTEISIMNTIEYNIVYNTFMSNMNDLKMTELGRNMLP
jgi:hypothetical protein